MLPQLEKINWRDAALVVVDVQKDFCPGGALPVPRGDEIIPIVNQLIITARAHNRPVLLTMDWHPIDTKHFEKWPRHCEMHSTGAQIHDDILTEGARIFAKGMDDEWDGYSAFEGRVYDGYKYTDFFDEILQRKNIKTLIVCGLATDYCVKETAIDAVCNGYKCILVKDACRAVSPDTEAAALEEMETDGVEII